MAKNYARDFSARGRKQKGRFKRGWVMLFVLFGLLALFLFFVMNREQVFLLIGKPRVFWQVEQPAVRANATVKTNASPERTTLPAQEVQFDFYGELPKMKTPPLSDATSTTVAASQSNTSVNVHRYLLQIGEHFTSQAAAAQMRLSLLLAGIDTEIGQETLRGKTVWTIQQGPFSSMAAARTALKRLHAHKGRALTGEAGEAVENSQIVPI